MATEPRMIATPNVYVENDGIVLPAAVPAIPLSAITLLQPRDERPWASVRFETLRRATNLLRALWPARVLWLMACSTAWAPDTRMLRHVRLWNSLTRQGLRVPARDRSVEVPCESDEGIRWFGRVRMDDDDFAAATDIAMAEPASLLVATAGEAPDIDVFLNGGWSTSWHGSMDFWARMALVCTEHDQLLVRPFGAFDDREGGVNILGAPARIGRMFIEH